MIFHNKATLSLILLFGVTVQHAWCMETDNDGYLVDDATTSVIEYAQPLDPNIVDIACADVPVGVKNIIGQLHRYPNRPLRKTLYLLVGESAVGKTTLARSIAQKENWPCVTVPVTELPNEYQDSAAAGLTRYINPIIEDGNKCVIVLDEITHLTDNYKRGQNNHDRTATTLWTLLDKCKARGNIMVIGTANYTDAIPTPLKTRLGNGIITISLPSLRTRTLLLRHRFESSLASQSITDACIEKLALKAHNKSFREIDDMYNDAALIADDEEREITENDINEALKSWSPWYYPGELYKSARITCAPAIAYCAPIIPCIKTGLHIGHATLPIALQIASFYVSRNTTALQLGMQRDGLELQRSSHALQVDGAALQRLAHALQVKIAAMQEEGHAINILGYHVNRLSAHEKLTSSQREFIDNTPAAKEHNIHNGYKKDWYW